MSKTVKPLDTSLKLSNQVTSEGASRIDVTVYKQGGVAVVREDRQLYDIAAGHNEITLEGMPTQCQPGTLTLLGYTGAGRNPGKLSVSSISYRAANLDKTRILQGSLGRKVTVKEALAHGRFSNTA